MDLCQTIALEDKYKLKTGHVFITGVQALVRLPMDQYRMDQSRGLKTAGFISGYRGSPLGGFDQQIYGASDFLDKCNIVFKEGLNEDLAASAVWGSQMTSLFEGANYQGVFGLWYGKAPGVDRSGDVFKHANFAGTSPYGGVLAIAGDDPTCKSSTLPSQSEFAFMDAEIPILCPSNIQAVLDYGLYGWALSRFSGLWVGMIALADNMDSAAVCNIDPNRFKISLPEFHFPEKGVHIRRHDLPLQKEYRLRNARLPAVEAFVKHNKLNKLILESRNPRIGIITIGQASCDVFEALNCLGISHQQATDLGLSIYKIAMPWPLVREDIESFAKGLETILIVEQKRPFLEQQIRSVLYDLKSMHAPQILGKLGRFPVLKNTYVNSILDLMQVILDLLPQGSHRKHAIRVLDDFQNHMKQKRDRLDNRLPYFCSGCPHNISTQLPDQSRALAGIGCHYIANFHDKNTDMTSHMGAEGVSWIGQSPFTSEEHIFVNLGDGTYSHSGSLAIRASVAAGTNITYKLLYNDAVAMTGGQSVDMKAKDISHILRQLKSEGVEHIAVVTDSIRKYSTIYLPKGIPVFHRRQMLDVEQRFTRKKGISVIVYDQMCATEKRRKRKRNLLPEAEWKPFINQNVCENCGDCTSISKCISVETVETAFGLKKHINQTNCNQDMSCVDGFCPSFVMVNNNELKIDLTRANTLLKTDIPIPGIKKPTEIYNIVFTGIGGAGVTTIAAILAMAAHIDDLNVTTNDMTGLAQKGGAVFSHVRIADKTNTAFVGGKIPLKQADILIAGDLIVSISDEIYPLLSTQRTKAVLNQNIVANSEVVFNRDKSFSPEIYLDKFVSLVSEQDFFQAQKISEILLGDGIYTNMILLGFSWQKGWIPISYQAIKTALVLNRVGLETNRKAFELGRLAAYDPDKIKSVILSGQKSERKLPKTLDEIRQHRIHFLTAYQNQSYAEQYSRLVDLVLQKEQEIGVRKSDLSKSVAIYYAKLMAYKDEYEIARLYLKTDFLKDLKRKVSGKFKFKIYLAPPVITSQSDKKGRPVKQSYGSWILFIFKLLVLMKGLRGSLFDPFGWVKERKMERQLIDSYQKDIQILLKDLSKENYDLAIQIARLPDQIRGFGYIKKRAVNKSVMEAKKLWQKWKRSLNDGEFQ